VGAAHVAEDDADRKMVHIHKFNRVL
jgi:hypothetical protein